MASLIDFFVQFQPEVELDHFFAEPSVEEFGEHLVGKVAVSSGGAR